MYEFTNSLSKIIFNLYKISPLVNRLNYVIIITF
nr:MAG TPA: hypothetical protein [Caudoviricetes sp.]